MGIEQVKKEVLKDAQKEAEQLVEEAEQKKEELLEEAEQKAESIREKEMEELENQKEQYKKKELSNANMKARQLEQKAKQKVIDRVFRNFRERLDELSDQEKQGFYENAKSKTDFEIGKVEGSKEFERIVEEDFEEIEDQGIVLVSEDGSLRKRFTFEKIMKDLKNDSRKEVAQKLFK